MQSVELWQLVHFANSRFFFHFADSRFFFISQNPDFFSFRKIQIFHFTKSSFCFFFHFTKSRFFFLHTIQIYRLVTSFSDSEHSPLECKFFLLSERSITSYVYLCLIFIIGSFRKIQILLLICNKQYMAAIGSCRKIRIFFFHFAKSRFYKCCQKC